MTRPVEDFKHELGDRVHSIAVGCSPEFTGTIVELYMSGTGKACYTVRNDEGRCWFRGNEELSSV